MLLKSLALTLILSQLLFSTKISADDKTHSEWIFQIRSESGFILSQGLIALKQNNSGNDFFLAACDFFQASGAITATSDSGCLITSIDDRQLYISKDGVFEGSKKLFNVLYLDENFYIATENLISLGYSITIEASEMLVSISHAKGLPVDRKNQLMSEAVLGKQKEIRFKSSRDKLSFNRFSLEGYTSPTRKGSVVEGDFDLLGGEVIARNCDALCLSFYRWSRQWKTKRHSYTVYAGNYDSFYFPGRFDRLKESAVVEINKKSNRQKFSFDYGATTDYFIYRNGVLIKKGSGSLRDIEIDLSEENYFSNYTIKVIDKNGQIQEFDLYSGMGLLSAGDYSLTGGVEREGYSFATTQLGLTNNINASGGYIDNGREQLVIKRAKTSWRRLRLEAGELTNTDNQRQNSYEQGEIGLFNTAYIYNHRNDVAESRDNKQHTFLMTPTGGLLQFQHRIIDDNNFENEYLLGKQIKDFFVYGRHIKYTNDTERQTLNVAGLYDWINYDVGTFGPWKTPGFFALASGRKGRWGGSANLDIKPDNTTVTTRADYTYKNKSLYLTFRQRDDEREVGVGVVFSFFPSHYDIDLKRQARTVVILTVFLDENGNGLKDPGELPLKDIKGALTTRQSLQKSSDEGKFFFEVDSNYQTTVFYFDESSFKEMHYLPTKENIRLDLNPRKVNSFEIPIKINGVVLLDCDSDTKIKDLKLFNENEVVYQSSTCVTPIALDRLKPGNYRASFRRDGKRKKKSFVLGKDKNYFHDIQFALQ